MRNIGNQLCGGCIMKTPFDIAKECIASKPTGYFNRFTNPNNPRLIKDVEDYLTSNNFPHYPQDIRIAIIEQLAPSRSAQPQETTPIDDDDDYYDEDYDGDEPEEVDHLKEEYRDHY